MKVSCLQENLAKGLSIVSRALVDLVTPLPQDRVDLNLTVRTQTVNLACGRVHANLKGIDAQEFPMLPLADLDNSLQLNVDNFREMINHVIFAAATDEARPILTGVLARIDSGQVTLAAADGFRLSVRTAHLSSPAPDAYIANPRSTVLLIGR